MSLNSTETVKLYLKNFRLPAMAATVDEMVRKAETEAWSYSRLLQTLCETEYQQRKNRKLERLIRQSRLPEGKTLATLNEEFMPLKIRRMLPTLLEGSFVERGENILAFGLPGRGKTHFLAALAHELIISRQYSVLFMPTFKLIQMLLRAKNENRLDRELNRMAKIDLVVVDDLGYVQYKREEMELFFTFLAERYERKPLMISSNLVFSQWGNIFQDEMTAMAAVDRLVHHSIILEFDGESIRNKVAQKRNNLNDTEEVMN